MIYETKSELFERAISILGKVASKNTTLPVLSSIIFEFKKGRCDLKATNLDIGVEVSVPGLCSEEITVAVPSDVLNMFISKTKKYSGQITIEINENRNMAIKLGGSKSLIKSVPHDDFPSIPKVENGVKIENIPTTALINGFKSVYYSASSSTIKPELSSIYLYKEGGYYVFVATDSFRLAEKKIKINSKEDIPNILIPIKNINHISHILGFMGDSIVLEVGKSLISIESTDVRVVSRVIEGVFPDYKQIIPKNITTEITILKQDLVDALSLSNVFSDKFNQMKLSVEVKEKRLKIETKNADVGENSTEIDAEVTGESTSINFNQKYITDCIQSIESDSISMYVSGAQRPMIIRPVSNNQDFMYIAMPNR